MAYDCLNMELTKELPQDQNLHGVRAMIAVGTHVWCGYKSGKVHIWDATDGEMVYEFSAHTGVAVTALFYSPHTQEVWSGGEDGKVCVWNALTRTCVRTIAKHTSAIQSIVQIGAYIWTVASDAQGLACLWEAEQVSYNGNGIAHYSMVLFIPYHFCSYTRHRETATKMENLPHWEMKAQLCRYMKFSWVGE